MKLIVLIVALVGAVLAQEVLHNRFIVANSTQNRYCPRKLTCTNGSYGVGSGDYIRCSSVQDCTGTSSQLMERIRLTTKEEYKTTHFVVDNGDIPHIMVAGGAEEATGGQYTGFHARMAMFKIVEFIDTDGDGVFDPNYDTVVKTWEVRRDRTATMNQLRERFESQGTSPIKGWVHVITGPVLEDFPRIEIITEIAEQMVYDNATLGIKKNVLSPDSVKVSYNVTGIKYSSTQSHGIALAFAIMTKNGGASVKNQIENNDPNEERPEASSSTQGSCDLGYDAATGTSAQVFMNYKKEYTKRLQTGEGEVKEVKASPLRDTDVAFEFKNCQTIVDQVAKQKCMTTQQKLQLDRNGASVKFMYFSFTGRPENVEYDPYLGAYTAGANSFVLSISALALVLLFLLF